MAKRKAASQAASASPVTADQLLATVPKTTMAKSIVASAAGDQPTLEALILFSAALQDAASGALKKAKRAVRTCRRCDGAVTGHCVECDVGLCDACWDPCASCGETVGAVCCRRDCDFSDGLGGRGCGEPVCEGCYVTTECERDVGGCQDCLDDYDCPDCDQCAGSW